MKESKIKILKSIINGNKNFSNIKDDIKISRPVLSHGLTELIDEGYLKKVKDEEDKRKNSYKIIKSKKDEIKGFISDFQEEVKEKRKELLDELDSMKKAKRELEKEWII